MANENWNMGEEIWQKVNEAIENFDKQAFDQKMNDAMNKAVEGSKKAIEGSKRAWEQGSVKMKEQMEQGSVRMKEQLEQGSNRMKNQLERNRTRNQLVRNKKKNKVAEAPKQQGVVVPYRMKGNTSGNLMVVFGWIFALLLGIAELVFFISFMTLGWPVFDWLLFGFGWGQAGSIWMITSGNKKVKKFQRSKRYWEMLKEKGYCSIESIAKRMGLSEKKVRKDIKRLLADGIFPQASLDDTGTCLIGNQEYYHMYQQAREQYLLNENNTQTQEVAQISEKDEAIGLEYLREIERIQRLVTDTEFVNSLQRLRELLEQIFQYAQKNPEVLEQQSKFWNYYLPTTMKLLKTYETLSEEVIQGENIQETKEEIKNMIVTINEAFETLLNSFYESVNMDVSTDISVLQTMLANEGLKKSDF